MEKFSYRQGFADYLEDNDPPKDSWMNDDYCKGWVDAKEVVKTEMIAGIHRANTKARKKNPSK